MASIPAVRFTSPLYTTSPARVRRSPSSTFFQLRNTNTILSSFIAPWPSRLLGSVSLPEPPRAAVDTLSSATSEDDVREDEYSLRSICAGHVPDHILQRQVLRFSRSINDWECIRSSGWQFDWSLLLLPYVCDPLINHSDVWRFRKIMGYFCWWIYRRLFGMGSFPVPLWIE